MQHPTIQATQTLFNSRLATLEHLLKSAQSYFEDESFLQTQLITDMLPLGTQIAFTCNQPRNFALWCEGKPMDNLDPNVDALAQADEHITNTQALLANINTMSDAKLTAMTRIDLGPELFLELSGHDYIHEFLIPNFYFHLVTAYDILRMAGVPIGKRDYMRHLVPLIKTA